VGRFKLCCLLLMNDNHYPWFILVPEIPDIREIYQLNPAQQQQLMTESCYLAEQLVDLYQADKMNIAAIGNMVPQLHIHHIVRHQTDAAWPAPVWGMFAAVAYTEEEIAEQLGILRVRLVWD
jgi:diadenosine tetraphosphate (Ap4A) HIT family hydrolase